MNIAEIETLIRQSVQAAIEDKINIEPGHWGVFTVADDGTFQLITKNCCPLSTLIRHRKYEQLNTVGYWAIVSKIIDRGSDWINSFIIGFDGNKWVAPETMLNQEANELGAKFRKEILGL